MSSIRSKRTAPVQSISQVLEHEPVPSASNSSDTRKRATFCSRTDVPFPVIPPSPTGVIDTIRAFMPVRMVKLDRASLLKSKDFSLNKKGDGEYFGANGSHRKWDAVLIFIRRDDAVRVFSGTKGVTVEFSVPRVLGFRNDQGYRLTEADQCRAFESVTSGRFPLTTHLARIQGPNRGWRIDRIDLARNIRAPIVETVENYADAHHPDINSVFTKYGRTGLTAYGANCEICIYDPDVKYRRGTLKASLKEKKFSADEPGRTRFEFRYHSPVAIDRFAHDLMRSPVAFTARYRLPFPITCADGARCVAHLGFTNHLLNQILAKEARALGSGTTRQVAGLSDRTPLTRLGLLHLNEHPELWKFCTGRYCAAQVRRLMRDAALLKMQSLNTDLVSTLWPAELAYAAGQVVQTA